MITGNVDGISAGTLRGWLHVPQACGPAELHLTADGEVTATAVADQFRPDVEARFGTGLSGGFEFDLGGADMMCGRVLGVVHADTGYDFHASRWTFCEHAAKAVAEHTNALKGLFFAEQYRHRHGLETLSNEEAFTYYLTSGIFQGHDPCPWFASDYFREHHGELLGDCELPVIAYIRHQHRHDVRPSALFDPAHYGRRYGDLEGRRLLEHYVGHGHAEGRHPMEHRLPGSVLEEIAEMAAIEPSVARVRTDPRSIVRHALPTAANYVPRLIRRRFGHDIAAIVLVASIDGEDDIAFQLLEACRLAHGGGRALMIVTDPCATEASERPERDPDLLFLDEECHFVRDDIRIDTLHDIVGLLAPSLVMNVDSSAGWSLYRRYGSQLASATTLSAYVQRFERTVDERSSGHAHEHLADLLGVLSHVCCASRAIVERIQERHGLAQQDRDKLHVVYAPVEEDVRPRPRRPDLPIFWSGDPSERDSLALLLAIAAAMPARRFVVHGPADDVPSSIRAVAGELSNVEYLDDPTGIDGIDHGFLLGTPSDDALSRKLIRIVGRGIPVITPARGGVAELIDEESGWVVEPEATVLDYVTQISSALVQTEHTAEKARRGRALVARRHARSAFHRRLTEIGVLDTGNVDEGPGLALFGRVTAT